MKYIKIFENFGRPKVGDYVICKDRIFNNHDIQEFLSTNIGKIIRNDPNSGSDSYFIQYSNIPINLISSFDYHGTRPFFTDEIIYWSENKEELEVILSTKKYNM